MTLSPVHLGTVQRGPVHLTACGVLSRLVTMHPDDTTCPECRANAPMQARPGHLGGCESGIVRHRMPSMAVTYCPCIHRGGK